MELKNTINLGSLEVAFVEQITFDSLDNNSFRVTYNTLKQGGYIVGGDFESNVWLLADETDGFSRQYIFNLDVYRGFNIALKGFVLMCRTIGLSPKYTFRLFFYLKKIIWATAGLKDLERFDSYLKQEHTKVSFYDIRQALIKFSSFYSFPMSEEFLKILHLYRLPKIENRTLPPFYDVFLIDEIINKYSLSIQDELLKLKYYPVELWWYITNIIPMRPNEFLRMRNDCIEYREDCSYWIYVPRSKLTSDNPEQELYYQPLQINQGIYNFIKEYQMKIDRLNIKSDYLIPQDLYKLTHQFHYNDYLRYTSTQFSRLLIEFHDEIVGEMYGCKDLTRINPGDTRHFAIINMFLQGFNMLSISRMAGHQKIESPSNYYAHIPELMSSYAYHLFSLRSHEVSIQNKLTGGLIGYRRQVVDRGMMYEDIDTIRLRKTDYGFCGDIEDFPYNCVEDCRYCDKYIFKPPYNEMEKALEWLEDMSESINRKINEEISFLKTIHKLPSKESKRYNENELMWHSRNLQTYMDQKLTLDIKLLRELSNNESR